MNMKFNHLIFLKKPYMAHSKARGLVLVFIRRKPTTHMLLARKGQSTQSTAVVFLCNYSMCLHVYSHVKK